MSSEYMEFKMKLLKLTEKLRKIDTYKSKENEENV